MPLTRLMLFAKAPIPGYAKTRLTPALGAQGAADVHCQLVEHTLKTLTEVQQVRLELHYSEPHPFLWRMARRYGCELYAQSEGDLGQRMLTALQREPSAGVVIGSDCPAISAVMITRCLKQLSFACDTVLLPAEDGGYGLIGCHRPQQDAIGILFQNMPWGTAQVLEQTRVRAKTVGLRLKELDTIWDIDTPHDLERWQKYLQGVEECRRSDVGRRKQTHFCKHTQVHEKRATPSQGKPAGRRRVAPHDFEDMSR